MPLVVVMAGIVKDSIENLGGGAIMAMNEEVLVYTPLGKAKVVWTFPDGSYAIQYTFGGGQICIPGDPEITVLGDARKTTKDPRKFSRGMAG